MNNLVELCGQPIAVQMLNSYLKGNLPPLLILHGPDGTGKWSAAEAFIRQRLCKVGTGCGSCAPCRMLHKNNHPDFIQFPADRISIGDPQKPEEFTIRWLIKTRICYTPFSGQERFILFPAAEHIQHEAETALLKTLEDVPSHTRFIFITYDLGALKETIVSRGVCIPFKPLSIEDLRKFGEVQEEHLDLLGGSLHLIPFFQSELFKELLERISAGINHPLELLRLEQWLLGEEKKSFSNYSVSEIYSTLEMLDIFSLLLIKVCATHQMHREIWKSIFNFKHELHREMSGFSPYLISRLFNDLYIILFGNPIGKKI